MDKATLRRQIRDMKRQFTPRQLEELSFPVLERIRPLLRDASVIMAFYSLPDEVYTHGFLDEMVAAGKTVLLPQVVDDDTMILRRYSSKADLREGAFHIMEPVGECFSALHCINAVLVPGVAFDAKGHRLGRGKGYYDRFLRTMGTCSDFRLIGVCFDFQKVAEVPVDEYDVPMDIVV